MDGVAAVWWVGHAGDGIMAVELKLIIAGDNAQTVQCGVLNMLLWV